MDYKKTIELIKEFLIRNNYYIVNFFLFGSRASGNFDEDSDYDFLIVLKNEMSSIEKRNIRSSIRKFLIQQNALINMDLIIKDLESWEWESNNIGFLSNIVKKEGVLV
jgi:predicted nucleotidyltransferase